MNMRWIKRDGVMVLQERIASDIFRDVPLVEGPSAEPKEGPLTIGQFTELMKSWSVQNCEPPKTEPRVAPMEWEVHLMPDNRIFSGPVMYDGNIRGKVIRVREILE